MTDREKLIELLFEAEGLVNNDSPTLEQISDHLIANGVTFATDNNVGDKWIPVTERLPDDDIPSAAYLCYWCGHVQICKYWRTRKHFEFNGRAMNVTHWMPIPEPPKEVE